MSDSQDPLSDKLATFHVEQRAVSADSQPTIASAPAAVPSQSMPQGSYLEQAPTASAPQAFANQAPVPQQLGALGQIASTAFSQAPAAMAAALAPAPAAMGLPNLSQPVPQTMATAQPNPTGMAGWVGAVGTPASPYVADSALTQQQAMLIQQMQMQYQSNWLQLHYQQWISAKLQALAQAWQQPVAVLWANPQVQAQLQQEYQASFDANELYRQAALAVQAMGMWQMPMMGAMGVVSPLASPVTPLGGLGQPVTQISAQSAPDPQPDLESQPAPVSLSLAVESQPKEVMAAIQPKVQPTLELQPYLETLPAAAGEVDAEGAGAVEASAVDTANECQAWGAGAVMPQEQGQPKIEVKTKELSVSKQRKKSVTDKLAADIAEYDDELDADDAAAAAVAAEIDQEMFFEEQSYSFMSEEEFERVLESKNAYSRRFIPLFDRDDGLFKEANLFLRYIRDERRFSSYTVYTYKAIILRSIVILEKVLPHRTQESGDKSLLKERDALKQNRSVERKLDAVDMSLEIAPQDVLFYQSWASISRVTYKSLYRELNYGVRHQRRASASVAQSFHALSSFFYFLTTRGYLESDPLQDMHAPRVKNALPRVLSETEVNKMLDGFECNKPQDFRDLAIMELLYSSGLRVGELVGLDIGDINFDMREVRVLGKGNKERIVPMGGSAIRALRSYLLIRHELSPAPSEKALFINCNGHRLTTRFIQMKVKETAHLANLDGKVTPHKFRHAFATQLLNNGVNLRMVQEMLGHSKVTTTQIYTHLDLNRLKEVYHKAHPLANATHTQEERDQVRQVQDQTLELLDNLLKRYDPDDGTPI